MTYLLTKYKAGINAQRRLNMNNTCNGRLPNAIRATVFLCFIYESRYINNRKKTRPCVYRSRLAFRCGFRQQTVCPVYKDHFDQVLWQRKERIPHSDVFLAMTNYGYLSTKTASNRAVLWMRVTQLNNQRCLLSRSSISGTASDGHPRNVTCVDISWSTSLIFDGKST